MPFTFRRIGLACLAAILLLVGFVLHRDVHYQLVVQVSSSVPSQAQVFFDVGLGYREQDSQTVAVAATPPGQFQDLILPLPAKTIYALRFDPLTTAGHLSFRDVAIRSRNKVVLPVALSSISALSQIASISKSTNAVEIETAANANDASLSLGLREPVRLKRKALEEKLHFLLLGIALVCVLGSVVYFFRAQCNQLAARPSLFWRGWNKWPAAMARRCSSVVLPLDEIAIYFYVFCVAAFLLASILNLNGSSLPMYSAAYSHGVPVKTLIGAPRATRSDEWGYETPDVLGQALRADRFAVYDSDLGSHSVALLGNVPVRHPSTLFRPQFWPFFVLPIDYAFAAYWQSKALLLVVGLFTWLLYITRSSFWAIAGTLWYYFSPLTQWDYSWPTGLPEMIGTACLGTVCLSYLVVGRNRLGLTLASIGAMVFGIDLALCSYVPHMIPIVLVNAAVFLAWCFAQRESILSREHLRERAIAIGCTGAIIAAVGISIYLEVHQALIAITATSYPGQRVVSGGGMRFWSLISHFMQWTETEEHFPQVIGNLCEGSGFLWLAPLALFCFRRLELDRTRKFMLVALGIIFVVILGWMTLPISAQIGHLLALDKVPATRATPALGLANVAVVALSMSALRRERSRRGVPYEVFLFAAILALLFIAFYSVNENLSKFFGTPAITLMALFTAMLIYAFLRGQGVLLAFSLVLSNAIFFGDVNPVGRGLQVITESQLYRFARLHTSLLEGKWLVFSDSPISTGFLSAMGFQVYTGTRYCPDVDHFAIFRSRNLDVSVFNRLGYLNAHPLKPGESMSASLNNLVEVRWNVRPTDPILKQVGIRYVAFDQNAAPLITEGLIPLSSGPLDGFWLYQVP